LRREDAFQKLFDSGRVLFWLFREKIFDSFVFLLKIFMEKLPSG